MSTNVYESHGNSDSGIQQMSSIEYNGLLLKISRGLSEVDVRDLVFLCRGKIAPGNEETIQDVRSLFTELENHNKLGIDRLEHLKELLKAVEKWSLLKHVKKFEIKRREYNELLQQISQALDESNELERLILICRGQLSVESERNIHDVRTLFTELEIQNNLGIGRLNILKEILKATNSDDLLKKLEQFERRRDEEDEFESRRGNVCSVYFKPKNSI